LRVFIMAFDTGCRDGNIGKHAGLQAGVRHIKKLWLLRLAQNLKFLLLQAFKAVAGADWIIRSQKQTQP